MNIIKINELKKMKQKHYFFFPFIYLQIQLLNDFVVYKRNIYVIRIFFLFLLFKIFSVCLNKNSINQECVNLICDFKKKRRRTIE
jgi:hypothetical protein